MPSTRTFKSASIFFLVFGVDADWEILSTAVPAQLLLGKQHQARGIIDLTRAVTEGYDFTTPITVKLTVTNSPPCRAILWFSETEKWVANDQGEITVTFDSSMITRGGTLPGRFLLEVSSDSATPFTVKWGLVPSAPISLTATPGNAQVVLGWTAATGNAPRTYNIKRSLTHNGPYTTIASGVSLLTYTDTTPTNGVLYYYVVSATNQYGEGPNSNEVNARPTGSTSGNPPPKPLSVTARWQAPSTTGGLFQLIVDWDENSAGNTVTWDVKVSIDNITFITAQNEFTSHSQVAEFIGSIDHEVVSYVKVTAKDGVNTTDSDVVTVIGWVSPLIQSITAGDTTIDLTWNAPVNSGAVPDHYRLSTYQGATYISYFDIVGTSYTVPTLQNDLTYRNTVTAFYADGTISDESPSASAIPRSNHPQPINLLFSNVEFDRLTLTWDAPTPPGGFVVDHYRIFYRVLGAGNFQDVSSVGTSTVLTGLNDGTDYEIHVSAFYTDLNESSSSNSINIRTISRIGPTLLTATVGVGFVDLVWTPPASGLTPSSYKVTYVPTGGGSPTTISGITTLSAHVTSLSPIAYGFSVKATYSFGDSNPSNTLIATPATTPPLTAPVLSVIAVGATTVDLAWTATSNGAGPPFSYTLFRDGFGVANLTSLNFQVTGLTPNTIYAFHVVAFDTPGDVSPDSNHVIVTTVQQTQILQHPQNLVVNSGSTATFQVVAVGTNLHYRWLRTTNGVSLEVVPGGTDSNALILPAVTKGVEDAYFYLVLVIGDGGNVLSNSASLTINIAGVAPTIIVQPVSHSVDEQNPTKFLVVASGSTPFTYQWTFNGVAIPGATSSNYIFTSTQLSNAGTYAVFVTNAYGQVKSIDAVLTVNVVAPTITLQPIGKIVEESDSATFTITATGSNTLKYQWRLNGANVSGATATSYTIATTTLQSAGTYTCVVSNNQGPSPGGGQTTSQGAQLTVQGIFGYCSTTGYTYAGTAPPLPDNTLSVFTIQVVNASQTALGQWSFKCFYVGQAWQLSVRIRLTLNQLPTGSDSVLFNIKVDGVNVLVWSFLNATSLNTDQTLTVAFPSKAAKATVDMIHGLQFQSASSGLRGTFSVELHILSHGNLSIS